LGGSETGALLGQKQAFLWDFLYKKVFFMFHSILPNFFPKKPSIDQKPVLWQVAPAEFYCRDYGYV